MATPMNKTAVILFNLGGPTSPDTVKPFLFNLFNDKAIISTPQPMRWLLAKVISGRRAPIAREIYQHLGGKSPIHEETDAQADALTAALETRLGRGNTPTVHIAMRYWGRRARDVVKDLKRAGVERTILLPLYPQYSTTTTASSIDEWRAVSRKAGLSHAIAGLCCYPGQRAFVSAMAARIRETLQKHNGPPPRLLFSAHGLPEKIVLGGDPYQWQVEQTAAAIVAELGEAAADSVVCYQSRVGPLKWIGPSTDEEIRRAGDESKPILIAPIAFVSEHSETLVELDIEYRHLADEAGVPVYLRSPTVGDHPGFIEGLADLVEAAATRDGVASETGIRLCPAQWTACPMKRSAGDEKGVAA